MKTKLTFIIFSLAVLFASCAKRESVQTRKEKDESKERECRHISFEYAEPIKGFSVSVSFDEIHYRYCTTCPDYEDGNWKITISLVKDDIFIQHTECAWINPNKIEEEFYIAEFQVPNPINTDLLSFSDLVIRPSLGWGFINLDGKDAVFFGMNGAGQRGRHNLAFYLLPQGRRIFSDIAINHDARIDFENRRIIQRLSGGTLDAFNIYAYQLNRISNDLEIVLLKQIDYRFINPDSVTVMRTFFQNGNAIRVFEEIMAVSDYSRNNALYWSEERIKGREKSDLLDFFYKGLD